MRILEARDGFIKFESEKKVALSSFILIKETGKQYVAQVIKTTNTDEKKLCFAKILFTYDGTLKSYDSSLPSKDAELEVFTFDILKNAINYSTPIIAGKFIEENADIPLDVSCFDKKMLICSDNKENCTTIVSNFTKQFSFLKPTLVIDMLGFFDKEKYTAGVDFKLPLNTNSLEFMFEDCLNDATSDSKSLIKDIFKDLSDYSKTVPFVPFGALKNIVDDMVDKSHIFKLLVLKNKLAKFDKLGYFAATAKESDNLRIILSSDFATIDLSKLDGIFQNRYLSVILSMLQKQNPETQIFVIASNAMSKKNIKTILTSKLSTTFVTHSRFKYINEISSMFKNFIIEPSFAANEVFKTYKMFLNSMQKNSYLLVGEGTNYIPLISSLTKMEFERPIKQEIVEDVVKEEDLNNESIEELTVSESLVDELEESPAETELDDNSLAEEAFEEIALETPSEEPMQISEKDPTEAIEKKSEALIEKVSEDLEQSEFPSLFEDEDTEDKTLTEEDLEEKEEIKEDFHTNVTPSSETLEEQTVSDTPIEIEPVQLPEETPVLLEAEPASEIEPENLPETPEDSDNQKEIETPEVLVEIDEFSKEESPEEPHDESSDDTSDDEIIELPDDISLMTEDNDTQDESVDFAEEQSPEVPEEMNSEPEVIPLTEEVEDFDEIVELDDSQITDDDILVELDEQPESENIDEEIVKDVDKVFTTMKEDSITDSDLDFIDELNNDSGEIEELPELKDSEDDDNDFLEPIEEFTEQKEDLEENKEILKKKESSTPIVPVYNADIPQEDMVISDKIEQGDTVLHAKYGTGIVEKMIKYGTKTLYSINFDNVGRRLLDPTLTEIKKA